MGFMKVVIGVVGICALAACQWPTAPVDDFSTLPDNVFSASVRKHVRAGSGPIDMSKFEQNFMTAFANEDLGTVTKAFQTSGGRCDPATEGGQELVTCKINFKWKTTGGYPDLGEAPVWLGLLYQIATRNNRVDGVKVRVHYDAPLN
jgi:hypothetical protein